MAANRARSIMIMTGRLRRNSTHGASGSAISAPAAGPIADSADTSAGPACNTSTAISGNAPNPSPDPYALTAYDAHSQPNCRPSRLLPTMLSALPLKSHLNKLTLTNEK